MPAAVHHKKCDDPRTAPVQAPAKRSASFYDRVTCNPSKETMPTYHVEMMEGRTIEQKKKLVEAITRVSVEILGGQSD